VGSAGQGLAGICLEVAPAAEMALTKAGRSIMEVQELQETDLPAALKTWGTTQITKASFDFSIVTEEFGKVMLSWWDGLGLKQDGGVDRILSFLGAGMGQPEL